MLPVVGYNVRVMDKRKLHHEWRRLRPIRPRYFLVVALICGGVGLRAMIHNNVMMGNLRSQVFAADKNGGDVNGALKNLQAYVTTHMNTNLSSGPNGAYPPIQLQYTYERLQQAQAQQQLSQNQANMQLYTDAQTYCQAQNSTDFSGRNRVPCITAYVQSHGLSSFTVHAIPTSLYEFDFVSPSWSPDLAGWSLVAAGFFAALWVLTWGVERWFKSQVN
jgi:hypothetical protein